MPERVQLAITLLIACNAIACRQQPAGENPASPVEVYVSKAGKFKVSILGKPVEVEQKTPQGSPLKTCVWESEGKNFSIGYSDWPKVANASEERLQELIDVFLKRSLLAVKATVTENSRRKIADRYVGRDIRADTTIIPAGKVRKRLFFVGPRLYRLTVVGTQEVLEGEEAHRFFDSFEAVE